MQNLWKPDYLLNLDTIDEQHKKFFELCRIIAQHAEQELTTDTSFKTTIRLLGAMRAYAFIHFKTEEELMLKYGFPEYLNHTEIHNIYLQKMMTFEQDFKQLLTRMNNKENIEEDMKLFLITMSEYIANWWGTHILQVDTVYAEFIKKTKSKRM
ncbi:MAG: hemerythrin family protein [Pseudodesulfovibrio sp.]|nr:hemerythrin family protein [Pseudodesulfovibrio sp.]